MGKSEGTEIQFGEQFETIAGPIEEALRRMMSENPAELMCKHLPPKLLGWECRSCAAEGATARAIRRNTATTERVQKTWKSIKASRILITGT